MAPANVVVLDYGAGNVRSLANALSVSVPGLSFTVTGSADAVRAADVVIFPGVGAFQHAMRFLAKEQPGGQGTCGAALADHVRAGKPYLGICIGMQVLFEGSDERHDEGHGGSSSSSSSSSGDSSSSSTLAGLGLIRGRVSRLEAEVPERTVPHMGWNTAQLVTGNGAADRTPATGGEGRYDARRALDALDGRCVYYVHSYAVREGDCEAGWLAATTVHGSAEGGPRFTAAVARGSALATQFHPEKSGRAGLDLIRSFVLGATGAEAGSIDAAGNRGNAPRPPPGLAKRIIACLDVRANDAGDLVVTKGDQYDVRERKDDGANDDATDGKAGDGDEDSNNNDNNNNDSGKTKKNGDVRNMGKPVELAARYAEGGADEVTFLNITSFRDCPAEDLPMLGVLERTSATVFVPLTVGGGIRDTPAATALQIASVYFRAGADKVSIGSDAVRAAAKIGPDGRGDGTSSIEQIAAGYGSQAVVISVDPRAVWVRDGSPEESEALSKGFTVVDAQAGFTGPGGETKCWYRCTASGGRENADLDVVQLVQRCVSLGAGEILVNSIDRDGTGKGFDSALVGLVRRSVPVPVIASSGAGCADHFATVFQDTGCDAALAAGIFHRGEVPITEVKSHLATKGIPVRDA